ncbi:hypothetical protein V7S43_018620 [Phytophthora oleae]|uniref:Uncharacterized protein n=1 Tax=Phytophthora oleae TaxID=2107226 RepID=A0ABD3EQX6_9STRA
MCNMVTMQTSLPAFVEDPALASASAKPLSLPMVIRAIAPVSAMPLSLPVLVEEPAMATASAQPLMGRPAVRSQASSEKYLPRADGASFQFQSEAFRLSTQAKISELILTAAASTETCSGTNALLAKKALKFRRVLERSPFASAIVTAVQC